MLFPKGQSGKKGVFVILGVVLLSKSMGMLREMLVAWKFGATGQVDAFVAAFTVYTLAVILPASLFPAAATPMFVEKNLSLNPSAKRKLIRSMFTLALVASAGLMILLAGLAPWLIKLVAPLFPASSHWTAARLLWVMLPMTPGIMLVNFATAHHNALRRFGFPQTSGIIMNTVIIAFLFMGGSMGIYALGLGWAVGYLLAGIILVLPMALWLGIGSLKSPEVKEFMALSLPLVASMGVDQINSTVDRMFASSLPEGHMSVLYYGWRTFSIPLMFLTALTTVQLTKAAEMTVKGQLVQLRRFTFGLVAKAALVLVPASLLIAWFAPLIIQLLFQRGEFSQSNAQLTATVLRCYSPALLPLLAIQVCVANLRGMKQMKAVLLATATGAGLNLAGDALLIRPFGAPGLAAASSIAISLNAAFLMWLIWKKTK